MELHSGIKRFVGHRLVNSHNILRHFFSDRYASYHFSGGRIYLNVKESPAMLARALGVYEVNKTAAVKRFLKEGQTFIDVGGNKGDFSLLAALLTGKNGKVLCFEPEPSNCYWIRQSAKLNGYQNIDLHELALSDNNGTSQLYLGQKSGWHTLLSGQPGRNGGVITVRTATLDSVLGSPSVARVDLIKIDVEGAELSVLEGARQTLRANHDVVLLIDIHPLYGVQPEKICGVLTEMGFSIYSMDPPFDKPVNVRGNLEELVAYRQ